MAELAKKLGISAALLYHVANGRRALRPIYGYALQGLSRELKMRRVPRHRPTPKTPPFNREQVRCSPCGRMMNRGNETKDPSSGVRLWRMFCKGGRKEPHKTFFSYVDDAGTSQVAPSKRHRRKVAPFENRMGIARCSECKQELQWQEEFKHRWGHSKLYSYRCTNLSGRCKLARKRVYRDPDGKVVERDTEWRLKRKTLRITDVCPVCGGGLQSAGSRDHGRLKKLNCVDSINTQGKVHQKDGIKYPGTFYHSLGRRVLYVFGRKRRPDGSRTLMNLARWIKQEQSRVSSESFLLREGAREFTIQEFADALQIHLVTAGSKLLDLERLNRVQACEARDGRRKAYRVTPIPGTAGE